LALQLITVSLDKVTEKLRKQRGKQKSKEAALKKNIKED